MDLNPPPPSSSSGFSSFPILAIALLAIMVTGLLLVTYYIVVIKCCINRPTRQPRRVDDSSWLTFSPGDGDHLHNRGGVDELVLRDIPTVKYKAKSSRFGSKRSLGERSFRGCAVCLSEFEDQELLRVLPHCGHVFHLDCIDVWLINNANCPLCRSNILGAPPKTLEQIVAPASSPQEIVATTNPTSDDQFVVIEIEGGSDGGSNKGIRRSFSMDSVADRQLLMQVQEIIRQNSSSSNRSFRRSLFSFAQGQASKSAVLPVQSDL